MTRRKFSNNEEVVPSTGIHPFVPLHEQAVTPEEIRQAFVEFAAATRDLAMKATAHEQAKDRELAAIARLRLLAGRPDAG